ncbi:wax ester/triacylglycerol synthase family O-acyltransferase [Nocardia sp. NPDC006630]|uniref:wax ester/triacylglycerol synthase family O-acyltransferase n=1 Tax=Nocardia sp. NPDC006630 TaxID=3157181 RepID=UPI0033ACCC2C
MTIAQLTMVDRAFLAIDSAEVAAHVAVLALFSPPPDAPPDFLRQLMIELRASDSFAPPFNFLLGRSGPVSLAPVWQVLPDDRIDLDYHLRHSALPAPGGERELGALISRLHARPLDPTKPLWECHLVEGLENGRFALYFKVHHSMMDGVKGARRLTAILSSDRADRTVRPPWSEMRPERRLPPARAAPGPLAAVRTGLGAVRALASVTAELIGEALTPTPQEVGVPFAMPPARLLNGRVGRHRRFSTQSYEFERIRAVATAARVTVNDVFLAICAGGLRRYLDELGELPAHGLLSGAPVSVRMAGDDRSNAIAFLTIKLGTDIADPLERITFINRSSTAAKEQLARLPHAASDNFGLLTQGPYVGQLLLGLAGRVRPPYHLVISNVPGPGDPRYLRGARLDELYPVSVVLHGQALNITAMSTASRFNIGFIGDRDRLPHLQRLALFTGEALTELETALGVG